MTSCHLSKRREYRNCCTGSVARIWPWPLPGARQMPAYHGWQMWDNLHSTRIRPHPHLRLKPWVKRFNGWMASNGPVLFMQPNQCLSTQRDKSGKAACFGSPRLAQGLQPGQESDLFIPRGRDGQVGPWSWQNNMFKVISQSFPTELEGVCDISREV